MNVHVSAVLVEEARDGFFGRVFGGPTAQVTITAPPMPDGFYVGAALDDDLQVACVRAWRALRGTVGHPRNMLTVHGREGTVIVTATVKRPAVTDPRELERIVAAAWPEPAQ